MPYKARFSRIFLRKSGRSLLNNFPTLSFLGLMLWDLGLLMLGVMFWLVWMLQVSGKMLFEDLNEVNV